MKPQIEIEPHQKIDDPIMDDSGDAYFTTFRYRLEGDAELYGDDFLRVGRVVWETCGAWRNEREKARKEWEKLGASMDYSDYSLLDDESNACDWDDYVVTDENGKILDLMITDIIDQ